MYPEWIQYSPNPMRIQRKQAYNNRLLVMVTRGRHRKETDEAQYYGTL